MLHASSESDAEISDRTMCSLGLNGKAFIPLLSPYVCAVSAIMAARTIENRRDRLATILIAAWLASTYDDMDWLWLVENDMLHGRQNRLRFTVSLTAELAQRKNNRECASTLHLQLQILETSRLFEEDTLRHDFMTETEKASVREHRTPAAVHWSLLTDLKAEQVPYAGSCSTS